MRRLLAAFRRYLRERRELRGITPMTDERVQMMTSHGIDLMYEEWRAKMHRAHLREIGEDWPE